MEDITAKTRLVGVIGDPITHSLSPLIHNTAFASGGHDVVSIAFEVADDALADFIVGFRAMKMLGMSVTMPHKENVVPLCDRVSTTARLLNAVNCLTVEDGELVGHNTDGAGLVDSIHSDLKLDPAGKTIALLGAGGAARAIVVGLAEAGASEIRIVNRDPHRARVAADLAPGVAQVCSPEDLDGITLLINATSLGMAGTAGEGQMPLASLPSSTQGVVDIVYQPLGTPLMDLAGQVGVPAINGVSMLIHQARHGLELWLRQSVDPAPIVRTVLAHLRN